MTRVSVVTPVYNGEKFLQATIDSLMAQTFTDWEWVVVDDGSTDSTPRILEEMKDSRKIYIRQPNGGEAVARNTGLSRVRGEFVAFLDADDLYLPNALADLVETMDAHPEYGVVFADGYICDEQGKRLTRLTDHRPGIHTGDVLEPLVLTASVLTVPVCTLTRRAAIELAEARFDPALVIGPDWDFWIQLARRVDFGYLDRVTCMYRVHSSNITRTSGWKKRKLDLTHGRMKVLNSDWFGELSQPTREKFLFNLVVELLSGEGERQRQVMEHPAVLAMPAGVQARLWRQAGADLLACGCGRGICEEFLHRSLALQPGDRKTRLLLASLKVGRLFARWMVRLWQGVHDGGVWLRDLGKPKPKRVPAQLRPMGK